MGQYSIAAAGAAALAIVWGLRAASVNRLIRKKLTFSLLLLAGFVATAVIPLTGWRPAEIDSIGHLLLALAVINAVVAVAVNPLRADRVPDRFPNILQDAVVLGAFLLIGAVFMKEKWIALSAVGGFVIGFALQDTLGNLFAGLAIQVEKPFHVGQWIAVGGHEGMVTEVTWRATRLRTKTGNAIVLPNNVLSKEAITNYSEPATPLRLFIDVGVTYDAAPNDVRAALFDALSDLDLVLKTPTPEVLVADFGSSAIVYRIRFWIGDYAADDRARDQVRTAAYYALKRHAMEIPYPIQVEYRRTIPEVPVGDRLRRLEGVTRKVDLFASLSEEERNELLSSAADRLYGAGESVVRQGQSGDSMFVVCRGEMKVTIEPGGREVARIGAGGYFGEMSMLTGEPRSATVSAVTDSLVLEITADDFRRLAMAHPPVVEEITMAVAERREGLQRTREAAAAGVEVTEARRSFLSRVQQFLRLPSAHRL